MRCKKCGNEIDDGLSFCTRCGVPLDKGEVQSDTVQTQIDMDPTQVPQQPQAPVQPQLTLQQQVNAMGVQKPATGQNRTPVIIGISAAVVVVAIIIVAMVLLRPAGNQLPSSGQVQSSISAAPSSTASSSSAPAQEKVFKGITNVRASSTLPTDSINARDYSAQSIIDGDDETCWCENVPGSGIDEYVAFSGPDEQTFSGFNILNGHQASERLYYINARPTSLRVIVDGEVKETVQLADKGLGWQTIKFAKPYTGKEVSLQIDTAVSGSSYDDCCITEVEFF